jgi:hypothetical protein
MPIPWLRLFDAAIGAADLALGLRLKPRSADGGQTSGEDARRLEFEREQLEAERRRAERALRGEWFRQAADRELGRLRFTAAVAAACWVGTLFLFLSVRLMSAALAARIVLGLGWGFLLGALAAAFMGQSGVGRALAELDLDRDSPMQPTVSGLMAPWFVVIGLALVGLAVLIA